MANSKLFINTQRVVLESRSMLSCSLISKETFDPNLFIYDFLMKLLVQPRVLESWSGHNKFWNLLVVKKEEHLCMNMKWDEGSI